MLNSFIIKLLIAILILAACKENARPKVAGSNNQQKSIFLPSEKKKIQINNIVKDKLVPLDKLLSFEVQTLGRKSDLDSICIFSKGNKIKSYTESFTKISVNTNELGLGRKTFKISGFFKDKTRQDFYYEYYIISNTEPQKYSYKIINSYSHDIKAFTQGLVYENNFLYEGTGQWGTSSLRKIIMEKNEIIQTVNLASNIFGEGICIIDDNIFQLTWRNNQGFVYDKKSFKLIREFEYFTEGWGLTTDGEKLIMSDGSNIIYFLDKDYFSEIERIEVYDNKGPVNMLNELEYIKGEIFANIYGQDYIVIIDAKTGKVNGKINTESIRPEGVVKNSEHAFNGIAVKGNNLLVTGKYWPVLYEIEIIPE